MTISATFTVTPHPPRSPCVANETPSILTTGVAAILKIADAQYAVAHLLAKHVANAAGHCPSLTGKTITPHTLRHYVDGWVMWPVEMTALAGTPRGPVPAT
jgi:hypothetical protein